MKRLYTFGGQLVQRNLTVADILAAKGTRRLTQTNAANADEARAVADAGIDMLVGGADLLAAMREGAPHMFITAGVLVTRFVSPDEILRQAYNLMVEGADAVYMPREPRIIEHLARAEIPVMTHRGLVPRTSTWRGGLRAVGTSAAEALEVYQAIKDAENAGAVLAEVEVVADDALRAIAPLTSMSIISLGSGGGGDVDYLFHEDICGMNPSAPRHARAFGDLRPLYEKIDRERRAALGAFRGACENGDFPSAAHTVRMKPGEKEALLEALAKR